MQILKSRKFIVSVCYYISNTVAGGIYRQKIIDYPYNFKMIRSSAFFLFVLFLALEASSQVLSPISQCFGNCSTCDLLSLSSCRSPLSCQWGFYDPSKNGTCTQTPSTQVIISLPRPQYQNQVRGETNLCVQCHQDGVGVQSNRSASTLHLRALSTLMYWEFTAEQRFQRKHFWWGAMFSSQS